LAKKYELDKEVVKDLIYGCIKELGQNKNLYYQSNFGPQYGHLSDRGEKVCLVIFQDLVEKVLSAEEKEYQERRKRETFDAIKNTDTV